MKILVVDDEQTQRDTLCRGLFLLGHRCVGAADSAEALAELDEPTDVAFDLLITDLTMPGESGLRLIERLRGLRPGLRVLVITGLRASEEVRAVRALGITILQKPFDLDQLQAAIVRGETDEIDTTSRCCEH